MKYKVDLSKNLSEEESQKVIDEFYTELHELYDTLHTLSWEEFYKEFRRVFRILHKTNDIILPNTTYIEQRSFEVFGKRLVDEQLDDLVNNKNRK